MKKIDSQKFMRFMIKEVCGKYDSFHRQGLSVEEWIERKDLFIEEKPPKIKVYKSVCELYERAFKKFWQIYPSRKGKKVGKKSAKELFFKQKESDLERIIKNAENYGINNEYPKDPERFLKNEFWCDWDKPQTDGTAKSVAPLPYYKPEKIDKNELPSDAEKIDLLKIR